MYSISATQIKMARAMLDWSQEVLAEKTRLSISTIRSLELGFAPRPSTLKEIRNTIESAGIEFIDGDGVKRRCELAILCEPESCEKILDDMLQTLAHTGGELIGVVQSQHMFMQSLGISNKSDLHRLERLHKATTVKCILTESAPPSFSLPSFQFRQLSQGDMDESFFYSYGNKHIIIVPRDDGSIHFVVMALLSQAQYGRNRFQNLWDRGSVLPAPQSKK